MNKEKIGWFGKIAMVLGSIVEVTIIMAVVFCGLKWFGNLLEAVCNYVNIGLGIFMICIIVMGFIYMDNKNCIEESKKYQKMQDVRKTQYYQK